MWYIYARTEDEYKPDETVSSEDSCSSAEDENSILYSEPSTDDESPVKVKV